MARGGDVCVYVGVYRGLPFWGQRQWQPARDAQGLGAVGRGDIIVCERKRGPGSGGGRKGDSAGPAWWTQRQKRAKTGQQSREIAIAGWQKDRMGEGGVKVKKQPSGLGCGHQADVVQKFDEGGSRTHGYRLATAWRGPVWPEGSMGPCKHKRMHECQRALGARPGAVAEGDRTWRDADVMVTRAPPDPHPIARSLHNVERRASPQADVAERPTGVAGARDAQVEKTLISVLHQTWRRYAGARRFSSTECMRVRGGVRGGVSKCEWVSEYK
ncbi:uncharacterized protein SETTUDRAFT_34615 [Exserohilum turcica Et28A]|uniref:Uncharacterized protein n=1 Tax=Exserohilum turcicum (strain 28A) TaxID=671987 RepID=R0I8J4_EXST2|nr:uncharacterized protein SETTUDRAFT_34615 [Exserohilum turcica Et28A]EOA81845.1 hypothetical protein SETTUDRAFT_34615 [Exserohilum turcica Et28A]